jgi:hypothetical protein
MIAVAQELDEKGFESAKQLKNELAKAVPAYFE